MTRPTTAAVIVAAGRGERAGGTLPKQFAMLAGRPVVAWSHDALSRHPAIDEVVVVVAAEAQDRVRAVLPNARFVVGGATRQASVLAGVSACLAERVLVHDAARPFVSAGVVDRLIAALDDHDGAVPVLPVADTLAYGDALLGDIAPRADLNRVQTPQAFHRAILETAHRRWTGDATDDSQMVRAIGGRVALVEGDMMLEKITYPGDLAAAAARLNLVSRTATGFDVHRLENGETLWLGGVLIPHHQGLSGHSDADVALHALTDALLGTIAAGDIGSHFPPSDMQWKGASSDRFLVHAADLIAAKGGHIDFVDLTIICEAPKIGPHRDAIRARIAELLSLSRDQVSVKATTSERLGFTGRGEGIAAQASASVRVPMGMA